MKSGMTYCPLFIEADTRFHPVFEFGAWTGQLQINVYYPVRSWLLIRKIMNCMSACLLMGSTKNTTSRTLYMDAIHEESRKERYYE